MQLPGVLRQWGWILSQFAPCAQGYWLLFYRGLLCASMVVAVRLTLPWLFKALLKPWLHDGQVAPIAHASPLAAAATIGVIFIIMIVWLGYADARARLHFARFSIAVLKQVRARAFAQASRTAQRHAAGDTIARLISDANRIKAGLKGFLIHVATHGMLLVGVSVVLLWVDLSLGLCVAGATCIVLIITLRGAVRQYHLALRFRNKEGRLADTIQSACNGQTDSVSFTRLNQKSERHEASLTRTQGYTTLGAHAVFGFAVAGALGSGVWGMQSGRLTSGDLMIFMLYALQMRAPLVQIARQGTRLGRLFACGQRLVELSRPYEGRPLVEVDGLREQIELQAVAVGSTRGRINKHRLDPVNLVITTGARVLVTGPPGSGKTTLLSALANTVALDSGRRLWDGADYQEIAPASLRSQIYCVEHDATWPRMRLGQYLHLLDEEVFNRHQDALIQIGVLEIINRFSKGLAAKVASTSFSCDQRRRLQLARVMLDGRPVVLLDEVFLGWTKHDTQEALAAVFHARADAAIVVAMTRPPALKPFDLVIELKKGKIRYCGNCDDWAQVHGSVAGTRG